jgi:hypothetical protein
LTSKPKKAFEIFQKDPRLGMRMIAGMVNIDKETVRQTPDLAPSLLPVPQSEKLIERTSFSVHQ